LGAGHAAAIGGQRVLAARRTAPFVRPTEPTALTSIAASHMFALRQANRIQVDSGRHVARQPGSSTAADNRDGEIAGALDATLSAASGSLGAAPDAHGAAPRSEWVMNRS
jgi:hypothetical protein